MDEGELLDVSGALLAVDVLELELRVACLLMKELVNRKVVVVRKENRINAIKQRHCHPPLKTAAKLRTATAVNSSHGIGSIRLFTFKAYRWLKCQPPW